MKRGGGCGLLVWSQEENIVETNIFYSSFLVWFCRVNASFANPFSMLTMQRLQTRGETISARRIGILQWTELLCWGHLPTKKIP
jgi:hypothetical protein